MLESIRNRSNGPVAKFIIGLIIIPFAFAGVYSYMNVNTSNGVATVNGEEISLAEFDRSYRLQQQNWGENFDLYFNTDERIQQFRISVLQQLINQRLSRQAINDMGLRTSDNQLRKVIKNTVEFQNEDGVFDEDRYEMLVRSGGYTSTQYQISRKSDMASSQFLSSLQETSFVLKNELELNNRLQNQTRDIDYLIIPQQYYIAQVDLTGEQGEQAINSYYEMNKSRFAIPEKVSIEYLYLTKRDATNVVISDGQIADYYNDNSSSYETSERRRLAHILVAVEVDAGSQEINAAKSKIDGLAVRINSGESFEDVARDSSDDSSTAETGGDLDWIEIGMMDESFEDAAFGLAKVDSVSSVVRTDFGFHLIKVLEIETGDAKSLEELKGQIIATLQEQFVEDRYLDLKESVSELAFEVSDTLTEAAESNSLIVRSSNSFDSQFGIGLPAELQNQPAVIESAFSDDVLYQGVNSELIELSDGNAVVLRLLEHKESGIKPVSEVQAQIIGLLTQQGAREATEGAGNEIISALNDGQSNEAAIALLPEGVPTTWQQQLALGRLGTEIDAQLRDDVFTIPSPKDSTPVIKGVTLSSGDFAIVKLSAVNDGTVSIGGEGDNENIDELFLSYHSQGEVFGYLNYLDANASISRSITNVNLVQ